MGKAPAARGHREEARDGAFDAAGDHGREPTLVVDEGDGAERRRGGERGRMGGREGGR